MASVGRNDPCSCGSGKKYKKCCLVADEAIRAAVMPRSTPHFTTEIKPDLDAAIDAALGLLESGQSEQAERDIRRLFDESPNYHMTNFAMGTLLAYGNHQFVEAVPYFEDAVAIFPVFGEAYFNLGKCYLSTAQIGKAVYAFRSAQKYMNGDDLQHQVQSTLDQIERTVVTPLMPTLDEHLRNEALFTRAFDALKTGAYELAIALFQRVLEKEPNNAQSYGNMALAHGFLGQKSKAMECFDKSLAIDPNYEPAMVNRVMMESIEEGMPLKPAILNSTSYYADYKDREKGAYVRDIIGMASVQDEACHRRQR